MADDTVLPATPNDATFERLPSWLQHRLKELYGKRLDALLVIAKPDEIDYVGETNTMGRASLCVPFEQVIHLDDLLLRRTRLRLLLTEGGLGGRLPRIKTICKVSWAGTRINGKRKPSGIERFGIGFIFPAK